MKNRLDCGRLQDHRKHIAAPLHDIVQDQRCKVFTGQQFGPVADEGCDDLGIALARTANFVLRLFLSCLLFSLALRIGAMDL